MKKISLLFVAFLFSLVIGLSSCNGCGNNAQDEVVTDTTTVVKDSIDIADIDSIKKVDSINKSLNKPLGEWP